MRQDPAQKKASTAPLLVAALALVGASLAPAGVNALEPLPPATAALLARIRPDKPPEKLTQETHFVVSDELRPDQFREAVTGLGGAYVGVGTDQNYTMAAWARPEVMILLDFDQIVVDLHRVYGLAFARCADTPCFIDFWSPEKRPGILELIKESYADPRMRRRVSAAYRMGQKRVHRRLLKLKKVYSWLKVPHFLTHQAQFDYLKAMFATGRVFMVRGDLTADVTMRDLAGALRGAGLVTRVLYISNCEMYFKYSKPYRKNIRRMPVDERSVLLRTRAWRQWVREGKKPLHYLYVVQAYENFRGWLRHRSVKSIKQLIPYSVLKPGVLYYEINETLAQRRERLRAERRAARLKSRAGKKRRASP